MKAIQSKLLTSLLKQPDGRAAVRRAMLAAVSSPPATPVALTVQLDGRPREFQLSIVQVRN